MNGHFKLNDYNVSFWTIKYKYLLAKQIGSHICPKEHQLNNLIHISRLEIKTTTPPIKYNPRMVVAYLSQSYRHHHYHLASCCCSYTVAVVVGTILAFSRGGSLQRKETFPSVWTLHYLLHAHYIN